MFGPQVHNAITKQQASISDLDLVHYLARYTELSYSANPPSPKKGNRKYFLLKLHVIKQIVIMALIVYRKATKMLQDWLYFW